MYRGFPKTPYAILILATILGSTLAFLPAPGFAATIGCASKITVSTVLNQDIGPCLGNGLIIGHNRITLDCAGHSITGKARGSGIILNDRIGVVIKDCNVERFVVGFLLTNSFRNVLIWNTASLNSNGFGLTNSSNNILKRNTAINSTGQGFLLYFYSDGNNLTKNFATGTRGPGFELVGSSDNNLTRNTGDRNQDGFALISSSINNVLIKNTGDNNLYYGFTDGTSKAANFYSFDECSGNGIAGSNPRGLCTALVGL